MLRPRHLIAASSTAVLLSLAGCVVAPYPGRPVGYGPYAQPAYGDAPYVEAVPVAPYPGAIWIRGYWGGYGGRHWVPGRWQERPGPTWRPYR